MATVAGLCEEQDFSFYSNREDLLKVLEAIEEQIIHLCVL